MQWRENCTEKKGKRVFFSGWIFLSHTQFVPCRKVLGAGVDVAREIIATNWENGYKNKKVQKALV